MKTIKLSSTSNYFIIKTISNSHHFSFINLLSWLWLPPGTRIWSDSWHPAQLQPPALSPPAWSPAWWGGRLVLPLQWGEGAGAGGVPGGGPGQTLSCHWIPISGRATDCRYRISPSFLHLKFFFNRNKLCSTVSISMHEQTEIFCLYNVLSSSNVSVSNPIYNIHW